MPGEGEFKPFHSGEVPRYQEIGTFMRAARAEVAPPLEIALVGVPLDLGATYRGGARHGPAAVREASRLIRQVNPATGVAPFQLGSPPKQACAPCFGLPPRRPCQGEGGGGSAEAG